MRIWFVLPLLTALALAGCAHKQEAVYTPMPGATPVETSNIAAPTPTKAKRDATQSTLIVTPGSGLVGKVVKYNNTGRFVVLEYPVGHLPATEQRLFVYRGGLKVGEVKATTWQRDDHIVADLTAGEAQAGDEVRDK